MLLDSPSGKAYKPQGKVIPMFCQDAGILHLIVIAEMYCLWLWMALGRCAPLRKQSSTRLMDEIDSHADDRMFL